MTACWERIAIALGLAEHPTDCLTQRGEGERFAHHRRLRRGQELVVWSRMAIAGDEEDCRPRRRLARQRAVKRGPVPIRHMQITYDYVVGLLREMTEGGPA